MNHGTSGSQAFTTGVAASSVSQSATTVLDRFIQIPPTITIREGHRVKVYFMQDMLLPAYDNHTIPNLLRRAFMLKTALFTILSAASVLVLAGCESHHQAKADRLLKDYDRLAAQFQSDCSAEYDKEPPNLSPKCQREKDKMDRAWKRLKKERK